MSLHIAALRSSFAAGISMSSPTGPKSASRSANNYAHILANRLDARLTTLMISGATPKTVGEDSQTTYGGIFYLHIKGSEESGNINTITAGGNKLG
jgi:hypothetical protein